MLVIPSDADVRALLRLRDALPPCPFTSQMATAAHVDRDRLRQLVRQQLVRQQLRNVYVDASIPDSHELRLQALALVAPPGCVVCDWTASWTWVGLDQPGSHLELPPPSVFRFRDHDRLRHGAVRSGERWFLPEDVVELADGLFVTTPLRTSWDMGRFAYRYVALGAMDALMRGCGVSIDELVAGVGRFRRQRGVVQLRELAPLVDPRSESIGESAVRLHWLEIPIAPPPQPQVVVAIGGKELRLDVGNEEIWYAAEYDGEAHHSTQEQKDHDEARREAIRSERGWSIDVFRRKDVFGQHAAVGSALRRGIATAIAANGRG